MAVGPEEEDEIVAEEELLGAAQEDEVVSEEELLGMGSAEPATPAAPPALSAAQPEGRDWNSLARRYLEAGSVGGLPLTVAADVLDFDPANAMRLYAQGMSRNFLGEGVGAMESGLAQRYLTAASTGALPLVAGVDALGGDEDQKARVRKYRAATAREDALVAGAREDLGPAGSFLMETAGGMWGPRALRRPGLAAGVEGAVGGAGAAESIEDVPRMASLGGSLGVAAQAAGSILGDIGGSLFGRISNSAGRSVDAASDRATELAEAKVAAEIASAKGKLGAVTQEGNRAVENLMRLEASMTPEQAAAYRLLESQGVLPALKERLGDSMLEQVPGAANRIDQSRAVLEGLTGNRAAAAGAAAEEILSGAEAKRQVGERLKRYLPTIVGSTLGAGAGGAAGFALGGSPTEALIGGLAGAGVRPALRAGQRMLAHPAVQRSIFAPIESGASSAAASMRVAGPLAASATRAAMSTTDWLNMAAEQNPEALGPYADTLAQAKADGRLAMVHYVLEQKDPQYREMLAAARAGGVQ